MSSPNGVDRPALMRELLALCVERGLAPGQRAAIALVGAGIMACLLAGCPLEELTRLLVRSAASLDQSLRGARDKAGRG